MNRRLLIVALLLPLLALSGCSTGRTAQIRFDQVKEYPAPQRNSNTLRIGVVTMLSPRESFEAYRDLADYLGKQVGAPADLVLRKSYSEVNELVRTAAVDVALVGYGGYEAGKRQFGMEALVTGQTDGSTESDALLLVRADAPIAQLQDLRERAIAFSDPLSYAGHLTLRNWMDQQGHVPEEYFSKVLFTFSQDGAVEAVVGRVADAAMVDAFQYRAYLSRHPELDGKLRVLVRLRTPGSMVVAVRSDLPGNRKALYQAALTNMTQVPEGRKVLATLLIERFVILPGGGAQP
ncbi:MAG TPA: PhnD/SsuA/transferrin family substrate-binding protein [Symbiobacteriaceae bacterium]|nr:PhnD/SsuA/transferrin family substrate-binding protein [Symbiobacteriaceae bacterium]